MVDKVFADWQKKPKSKSPNLDTDRKLVPFGNKKYNKFTLTNIPPAKTLDFESNLCYCYDCDLEQDFDMVKLPKRTGEGNIITGLPVFESIEAIADDNYYDPRLEGRGRGEFAPYSLEDVNNEDSDSYDVMSSNSSQFDSLIT